MVIFLKEKVLSVKSDLFFKKRTFIKLPNISLCRQSLNVTHTLYTWLVYTAYCFPYCVHEQLHEPLQ